MTAELPPTPPPPPAKTLKALLKLPAQMELCQMELMYRAEGNANLVLALPQFKKVLRLPKLMISSKSPSSSGTSASSSQLATNEAATAGVLTMPDFVAYIEIMRRLLGNEFVCQPDIVAIPNEGDRCWINQHIRDHRPVARLDKEFVGQFGLMLPDVTQLPATFDVLLANLQAKDMNTDMNADICNDPSSSCSSSCPTLQQQLQQKQMQAERDVEQIEKQEEQSRINRLDDTYAIEIKPKQGWLQLPSDVSDLFDLMPAGETKQVAEWADVENEATQTMDNSSMTCDPAPTTTTTSNLVGQPKLTLNPACSKCRCRYCSMQLLKLHTGKIKRLGAYCPLELFSGAPSRMLSALDALFDCPQNNLRVFQRGNLIYGDHENSISFDELQTRIFPGEYDDDDKAKQMEEQLEERELLPAFGCGMKTKATPTTTEIAVANVDATAKEHKHHQEQQQREVGGDGAAIVEFVKAVAGQPQLGAGITTQRCTKRSKMATTTTATTTTSRATTTTTWRATPTQTTCCESTTRLSTNVNVAMATATATRTETETVTTAATATVTALASSTATVNPSPSATSICSSTPSEACETGAQINKAEIFHLPKNCVLQKILHLQLLAKRHFHYMWQTGQAAHATPSYNALRGLLSRSCCPTKTTTTATAQQPLALTLANVDELLAAEEAYMLGATALDCSIMLTFQEVRCQTTEHKSLLEPWLVSVQGHEFLTKLTVLDLDPKPDSHFHKCIKQLQQISQLKSSIN